MSIETGNNEFVDRLVLFVQIDSDTSNPSGIDEAIFSTVLIQRIHQDAAK